MTIDKDQPTFTVVGGELALQQLRAAETEIEILRRIGSDRQAMVDTLSSDARRGERYTAALERLLSNTPGQPGYREVARESKTDALAWYGLGQKWVIVSYAFETRRWQTEGVDASGGCLAFDENDLSDFRPLPGRGTGRG